MKNSPSWKGNWFSASQEIPRNLWNPKVRLQVPVPHPYPKPDLSLTYSSKNNTLLCLENGYISIISYKSWETKTHLGSILTSKDLEQLLPVGPTKYVLPHSFTWGWEQIHFPTYCVIFGILADRQNPETKQSQAIFFLYYFYTWLLQMSIQKNYYLSRMMRGRIPHFTNSTKCKG